MVFGKLKGAVAALRGRRAKVDDALLADVAAYIDAVFADADSLEACEPTVACCAEPDSLSASCDSAEGFEAPGDTGAFAPIDFCAPPRQAERPPAPASAPSSRRASAPRRFTGSPAPSRGTLGASRRGGVRPEDLSNLLAHLDEGFSATLLQLIDARGLKDAQVYKRANMSRQHFSKIRANPEYRPRKTTALALAVALELSLEETRDLLSRAGYALSRSSKFDVIVEYFISHGVYDIFAINETLFRFDQSLLG